MDDTHFNHNQNRDSHPVHEVINHEQFEEMRDLLEEDFADLVQTYITDSQKRIDGLRVAQVAGDNANGFEAAHALKGASANLGATQLIALSGQLQEACRAHQISHSATLIEHLSEALQHVEQQIYQRLAL